jgi:Retroviral aspartyl protease
VNPSVLTNSKAQVINSNYVIVMVTNRAKMVTNFIYQNLWFSIHDNKFCHDLKLLPMQGYDIILGLNWLSTLDHMYINWNKKWIEFQSKSKMVKL